MSRQHWYRVVWLVAIIEFSWVVLVNGAIRGGLVEGFVNRSPEKLEVHWERAWSWFPPRIHAEGLSAELHTWTMDVEARASRASGSVRFLPLLNLRGVLGAVDVHHVAVSVVYAAPDGPRPAADPLPPGLRMGFEDIEVHGLERVAFNDMVIDGGEPSVRGSARRQVRGPLTLHDLSLDWPDARITVGGEVVAPGIALGLHGDVGPFHPDDEPGRALRHRISGVIDVNGHSDDLRPLHLLLHGADWIERLDGSGDVAVHLVLDRGRLLPGTDVDILATSLELWFLGFLAEGEGHVTIDVAEHDDVHRGEMDVVFEDFGFLRRGEPEPLVRGAGFRLRASAQDFGFKAGADALDIVVDFPGSQVPDVARLSAALPTALDIGLTGGSAKASGHIEVHGLEKDATGVFEIAGTDLQGRFRDMRFGIDLAFVARLSGRDLDGFDIQLDGTEMRLFDGRFEGQGEVEEGWWMTMKIPEGKANLARPAAIDAKLDLSMRDSRAVLAAFAEISRWIDPFDRFLTVKDVKGHGALHVRSPLVALRGLSVTGDRLEALGEIELEDERHEGILWAKLGRLSLGVERIGKDNDFKLIHSRKWYDEQHRAHWSGREAGR
jgi:hypothetical protein